MMSCAEALADTDLTRRVLCRAIEKESTMEDVLVLAQFLRDRLGSLFEHGSQLSRDELRLRNAIGSLL